MPMFSLSSKSRWFKIYHKKIYPCVFMDMVQYIKDIVVWSQKQKEYIFQGMLYLMKKHFLLSLVNYPKFFLKIEFILISKFGWMDLAKLMAHTKSFKTRRFLERKNQQPCLFSTLQIIVTLMQAPQYCWRKCHS